MSFSRRVLLGVLIGACIVLFGLADSRSLLLAAWTAPSSRLSEVDRDFLNPLVEPSKPIRSPIQAAAIFRLEAENATRQKPSSNAELRRVARDALALDPDNAYWRQLLAMLCEESGNLAAAEDHWIRASKASSWNDYQTALIKAWNNRSPEWTDRLSWRLVHAYDVRTAGIARRIVNSGRGLLLHDKSAAFRFATMKNAELMRNGSRSLRVAQQALALANATALTTTGPTQSVRVANRARYDLKQSIEKSLGPQEGQTVDQIFAENDAWEALSEPQSPFGLPRQLAVLTALSNSLPSALLGLSLLGLIFQLLAWIPSLLRSRLQIRLFYLATATLGTLGAWSFSSSWVASLVVGGAMGLPALFNRDSGAFYGTSLLKLVTIICSLAVTVLLLFFVSGDSAPGYASWQFVGAPEEFIGGSPTVATTLTVIIGLTFCLPLAWALSEQIGIDRVYRHCLGSVGRLTATIGFVGLVLATPACLLADRQLHKTWTRLVENEPLYYLNR
ncbi:MAG: hypothetical protein JST35_13040 [Armatimonadetes bacterium]|nr:hypothetical protein [Armatimonadota bacterium]